MSNSAYNPSNTSLDDILRELEERFGSASEPAATPKRSSKKQQSSPKMVFAALGLFVALGGAIIGTQLAEQQASRQVAYLPTTTQQGSVQGVRVSEPEISLRVSSLEAVATPVVLTENEIENALGMTCDGPICTLADSNWAWQSDSGDQVPVTCAPSQEVWRFFCPSGVTGQACLENGERLGAFQAGQMIDLAQYTPASAGVYQFNFNDPETVPTSATCGAVQIVR